MNKTIKYFLGFCFLFCGIFKFYAQQGTVASGGDATGSGGSISFTIGQIDFVSATDIGGSVNQGLQQPYEIFVVTGVEEKGITLSASVYPNPTSDFVILKVKNGILENFTLQLCDIQGKILFNKKIESSETTVSMVDLSNAIYFIKVLNNNNEVKVFKVIKN